MGGKCHSYQMHTFNFSSIKLCCLACGLRIFLGVYVHGYVPSAWSSFLLQDIDRKVQAQPDTDDI